MRRLLPIILLAAAAMATPSVVLAFGERYQAHADCTLCHGPGEPSAANLSRKPAAACDGCHAERSRPGVEHAVGGIQANYRGTLPLPDGKVACVSCHQWHVDQPGGLHKPADQLCQDCHPK